MSSRLIAILGLVLVGGSLVCAQATDVVINGTTLTEEQLQEMALIYGIQPVPGDYWYDPASGLYGVQGFGATGFLYPDHPFGALVRSASSRDTKVLINSRELGQEEYVFWSQVLGVWLEPGAYWIDSAGNLGFEGLPVALANIHAGSQPGAPGGSAGQGDNFWSSSSGAAGNMNSNGEGYISVPGGGSVTFGF